MCDGVSCISHHLSHAGSDVFDKSALVPIKKISFLERLFLRLSFPFYIPQVLHKILFLKQDINPLHDGKRILTGKKRAATTSDLLF